MPLATRQFTPNVVQFMSQFPATFAAIMMGTFSTTPE
jgi:hypothetical protein